MDIFTTNIPLLLMTAMAIIESNNNPDAYNEAEDAVGILQIRPIWVQDVNRFSTVTYTHDQMKDLAFARMACLEYWRYYAKQINSIEGREVTAQDLARIHNGGPEGYIKKSTEKYWKKVEVELNKILEK